MIDGNLIRSGRYIYTEKAAEEQRNWSLRGQKGKKNIFMTWRN